MKNIKKITILLLLLVGFFPTVKGQLVESHNQYYLAPYLINPGALGGERVFGIDLNYRKLYKEIPEAPESFKLLTQLPIGNHLAIGITAFARRESIFESVGGMASVSYSIPLSANTADVHFLSIGFSAGYAANQANESLIDNPFDPAVLNLSTNPGSPIGQFGLSYQWKDLSVGVSLNDMFNAQAINYSAEAGNNLEWIPLNQTFSYVKYNFRISENIKLSPWLSYTTIDEELGNGVVEGLLMMNYRELIWAGASYVYEVGPVFRIGFSLKRLLKIGYGYGINTSTNSRASDSHEMHLSYRKYDLIKEMADEPEEEEELAVKEEVVQVDSIKLKVDNTIKPAAPVVEIIKEAVDTVSLVPEPVPEPEPIPIETPIIEEPINTKVFSAKVGSVLDDEPGNYIIVGAFSTLENAAVYANAIQKEGYAAEISYYSKTNYHYVIIAKEEKIEIAKTILADVRTHNILDFEKAWILSIDQ